MLRIDLIFSDHNMPEYDSQKEIVVLGGSFRDW